MKKIVFAALALVMISMQAKVMGQNCDAIVGPFLQLRGISADNYPADKFAHRCAFSQNTFYFCDEVPEGAKVFSLGDLTDMLSQQKADANMVVDLSTLSYYRYNWSSFQAQDQMHPVFFRLGRKNAHRYLGLRTVGDAMTMCENANRNRQ